MNPIRRLYNSGGEAPPAVQAAARLLALSFVATVIVRSAWLSDDSMITLRCVRNLLEGFGPVYNVGERVAAFTHPLWMLLLSLVGGLTRELFVTPLVISCALSLGAVALLCAGRPGLIAIPIVLVLSASHAFLDYTSSGLENPLSYLLLALLLTQLFRPSEPELRAGRLGLLIGLLLFNRLDTIALLGPLLLFVLLTAGRTRRRRRLLLGLTPLLAWLLFATIYYGTPLPNTFWAKLSSGIGSGELFAQGLRYFGNSLRVDPVTLVIVGLGTAALISSRNVVRRLLAAGIVLHCLYLLRIGGDFMSGRFLTLPFLVALFGLAEWTTERRRWLWASAAICLLVAGLTGTYLSFAEGSLEKAANRIVDRSGIADERKYYTPSLGAFTPSGLRWAPGFPLDVHGKIAKREGLPVIAEGMIGVYGFEAGARTFVIDIYGLVDPFLARRSAVLKDEDLLLFKAAGGKPLNASWRIGHFRRNLPLGYLRSVAEDSVEVEDPRSAAMLRDVWKVTRGPLFALDRWSVILRWHLELVQALAPAAREAYRAIDYGELLDRGFAFGDYEYRLGYQRYLAGERGEAEAHARRAVELDGEHLAAMELLAAILLASDDPSRASEWVARAYLLEPRDPWLAGLMVDRLIAAQDIEGARRALSTVLDGDPKNSRALRFMVNLSIDHEPKRALRYAERLAALEPSDPEALYLAARLFRAAGREAEARVLFGRSAARGHAPARKALED